MAIQISGTTVINNSRELGSGLTSAYDNVNAGGSTTLSNRQVRYVTSDSQTITLPSSPSAGNEVVVINGNFTGVIIARNGSNIMGLAENMTMDIAYAAVTFLYVDATRGWVVI
jgi:hypothetical protein